MKAKSSHRNQPDQPTALFPQELAALIHDTFRVTTKSTVVGRKTVHDIESWLNRHTPEFLEGKDASWLILRGRGNSIRNFAYLIRIGRTASGRTILSRYCTFGSGVPSSVPKLEQAREHGSFKKIRDYSDGDFIRPKGNAGISIPRITAIQTLGDFRACSNRMEADFAQSFRKKLELYQKGTRPTQDNPVRRFLRQTWGLSVRQATTRFLAALDQPTLQTLRRVHWFDPLCYNWLSSPADPQTRLYRRQALETLPLIIPVLANLPDDAKHLTALVDAGQPWLETAGKLLLHEDTPPSHIRRLRKIGPVHLSRALLGGAKGNIIQHTGRLEHNWMPRTRNEWQQFARVIKLSEQFSDLSGKAPHEILLDSRGDWTGHATLLQATLDDGQTPDYLRTVFNAVVLPFMARQWPNQGLLSILNFTKPQGPIQSLYNCLLAPATTSQIIRYSRVWHENLGRYQARIENAGAVAGDERTWPVLTETVTAPNGIRVEGLSSAVRLHQESEHMDHCVRGRADRCFNGYSAILHLHPPPGLQPEHLEAENPAAFFAAFGSTLEVDINLQGKRISLGEHKLRHNISPNHMPTIAAKWYADAVNSRQLTVNWEHLAAVFTNNQTVTDSMRLQNVLRHRVGYDPNDREIHNRVFLAYRDIIPKAKGCSSVDDWSRLIGLDEAIENAIPQIAVFGSRQVQPN